LSTTGTKCAGSSTGAYVVPQADAALGVLDAQGAHRIAVVPAIAAAAIPVNSFERIASSSRELPTMRLRR
jgi:hypothetical protein